MKSLLVGLGGALGSAARVAVGDLVTARLGSRFPFGTLIINITGCFIIGTFMGWWSLLKISEQVRWLVPVGFVGAYTTFSTFAFETVSLCRDGAYGRAFLYVLLSNLVGFFGAWISFALVNRS